MRGKETAMEMGITDNAGQCCRNPRTKITKPTLLEFALSADNATFCISFVLRSLKPTTTRTIFTFLLRVEFFFFLMEKKVIIY